MEDAGALMVLAQCAQVVYVARHTSRHACTTPGCGREEEECLSRLRLIPRLISGDFRHELGLKNYSSI
jgi:hypothetical protein